MKDLATTSSFRNWMMILVALALGVSCDAREGTETFSTCDKIPEGWEHASTVTPDAVPPCLKGLTGTCPSIGHEYVKGTGWCRPQLRTQG